MGQTDTQFKAFIRFILEDVQDSINEEDKEKKDALLKRIVEKLQATLED